MTFDQTDEGMSALQVKTAKVLLAINSPFQLHLPYWHSLGIIIMQADSHIA